MEKLKQSRQLVISRAGPALPEDSIVGKFGVVGMSGSGKTNTARKLAEAMLTINQHIATLDPTGAWWGLRSSADGLKPGFPIVVFGGSHPDAPIRPDYGAMLGRALVDQRFNAIFDLSKFNDTEIRRFSTDFLNEVYIRNKHPLHVFMDEFDIICPQAKGTNSEEARAAVNTFVRRGRIKGLGSTMITQNPQDADKSVLNMADIVIAMRTQGSQAIDAIGKWMGRNISKDDLAELVSMLPDLETGTGFIWAPQLRVFSVQKFMLCKTFDSGKTPKMGETIRPPKILAQVDIEKLGRKIAATVIEAQNQDPSFLKKRITELEAQLAKGGKPNMELQQHIAELEAKAKDYDRMKEESSNHLSDVQAAERRSDIAMRVLLEVSAIAAKAIEEITGQPRTATGASLLMTSMLMPGPRQIPPRQVASLPAPTATPAAPKSQPPVDGEVKLRGKSMAMLQICAGMYPKGLTEAQVAMQSGMKRSSGTFSDYKSLLKTSGCVQFADGLWYATEEGMRRAGTNIPKHPTTTAEVLALWMPKLRGKSKDMLNNLVALRGSSISYAELADNVGMEARSGTFSDYLSLLRTMDLITTDSGMARANAEVLFL